MVRPGLFHFACTSAPSERVPVFPPHPRVQSARKRYTHYIVTVIPLHGCRSVIFACLFLELLGVLGSVPLKSTTKLAFATACCHALNWNSIATVRISDPTY